MMPFYQNPVLFYFFFFLISLGFFIICLSFYYSGILKSRLLLFYSVFLVCWTLDVFIEFIILYWFINIFSPYYFLTIYIILMFLNSMLYYLIPGFFFELVGRKLFTPVRYFFILTGIITFLFPIFIYFQERSFWAKTYQIVLGMRISLITVSISYALLMLVSIPMVIRNRPRSFRSFFVILSSIYIIFVPFFIMDIMDLKGNFLARVIHGMDNVNSIMLFFLFLTILNLSYGILFFLKIPNPGSSTFYLSKREKEIASLLISGISYKEISARFFISEKTVKSHAYNIYRKTGSHNRVELRRKLLTG